MKMQILTIGVYLAVANCMIISGNYEKHLSAAVGLKSFSSANQKPGELFSLPNIIYAYDLHDPMNKDLRGQEGAGDKVKNGYSVIENDGNRGIVEYNVPNPVNLFNTVVRKKPVIMRPRPAANLRPIFPISAGAPFAVRFLLRHYGYYPQSPFEFQYSY